MPDAQPPSRRSSEAWHSLHIWQYQPVRDLLALAGLFGIVYLGYMLRVVTVPMLLALMLAYLFEPVVRMVVARKWMSRQGAAVAIILGASVVIVVPATIGVGYAVVQGVGMARTIAANSEDILRVLRFARNAHERGEEYGVIVIDDKDTSLWSGPASIEFRGEGEGADAAEAAELAYKRLPGLLKRFTEGAVRQLEETGGAALSGDDVAELPRDARESAAMYWLLNLVIEWVQANSGAIGKQAIGTGANAIQAVARTIGSIGMLIFTGFLTAFFFYFFCTGWGKVLAFWEELIPERRRGRAIDLLKQMDRVIAGFVRGRLIIGLILAIFVTVAYWLIGVPAPLIVGPLVGVLFMLPYVSIAAVPLTILLMFLDPGTGWQAAWWWSVFAPIGVYAIAQVADDYFLTPTIQGQSTGMDVPTILFASLAGGVLAGIYGVLLAIPVAACVRILLRELLWPRVKAWVQGKERDFLPISRE